MNILKPYFTCRWLPAARLRWRALLAVVFSGSLILAAFAQAEDKQISYSVAVPTVHAEASSAAAPAPTPVLTAPAPVIRPIEQAASVPVSKKPSAKKAKAAAADDEDDEDDDDEDVKPAKKSAAGNKKATAKKSASTKSTAVKTAATSKKPAPKAAPEPIKAVAKATVESTPEPKPTALKPVAATLVAGAATAAALSKAQASEDEQLADSGFDDDMPSASQAAHAAGVTMNNAPLPMSSQREDFVNEFKRYVETKLVPRVPGVALAVIADGKVKVLQAYGVKKTGGSDPITINTAFRLASVSKTIAGTTAGVMVQDGLINWDTPLTSVLPNVEFSNPRYGNQLTLGNLLSQSSGLPTHSGDNYIEEGESFESVINRLKYINFVCPPGKCYAYQNVSFSLLANVVRKKTGKPYEQYVKEKIFAPLGMRDASVGMEGLFATNNYALPHVLTGRGRWYTEKITENYYRMNPAAGANASISDMSRWVLAHMGLNPEVLPPALLRSVHAKVTKNTPAQSHYGAIEGVTDTHYGMGWRTFDYRGDKNFLHHGGYVLGFRSEMVLNPELQIGMVVLSNCNKLPGDIIFKFLDAYEDDKHGERRVAAKAPAKKKK